MKRVQNKQKRKRVVKIEPKESILKNEILKTVTFSIIASLSVISMSFYFSEFSDLQQSEMWD